MRYNYREWKDGLISYAVSTAEDTATWIVFNGDVEPVWAEALNSALDDNRLLTLANGVGIKLNSKTRFIFETHELKGASPATVSRLGVVHLGTTNAASLLANKPLLESLPTTARDTVTAHLESLLDYALKNTNESLSASGLIKSVFLHLQKSETQTSVAYALLTSLCEQIDDQGVRNKLARSVYQHLDCT